MIFSDFWAVNASGVRVCKRFQLAGRLVLQTVGVAGADREHNVAGAERKHNVAGAESLVQTRHGHRMYSWHGI